MKFLVVSILAYALVAQAFVVPIIPPVGKIGHAVAAGVAGSVGLGTAVGVHAVVHGAKKVGSAVVGTGLGALDLGIGVASGIKEGISDGLLGSTLGSGERSRPDVVDEPERSWREGPIDARSEHGIIDKIRKDVNYHKRALRAIGSHKHHEHGKNHDWQKHEKHERERAALR